MIGRWAPRSGDWPQVLELLSGKVAAEWASDVSKVRRLAKQIRTGDRFAPLPGSSLARDDGTVGRYKVSHAALHNLNTGVTQLQTAQELMQEDDQRLIAAATLLRSSIEALAIALWILDSEERAERISRSLAWFQQNVLDERVAFEDFVGKQQTGDTRGAEIRRVAKQNGIELPKANARIQSSDALRYADTALDVPNHLLLYVWRLCSGVAHGRLWAFANLSSVSDAHQQNAGRLELEESNLLVPFRMAIVLLDAVVDAYGERTEADPVLAVDATDMTVS